MAGQNKIEIEIAYARPNRQRILTINVDVGTTARAALMQSALHDEFPDIDLRRCDIGVFGQPVADDYALVAGDRLEVYRPLLMDPREARRQLAARGKTMGSG